MTRDGMPKHDDPTELEPRPRPPNAPEGHSTAAQLRRDVESGATGDKVPVLDPAASPLGTDDEAAGARPTADIIDKTRRAERALRPANTNPGCAESPNARHSAGLVTGFIALVTALALGALWISFG